MNDDRQPVAEKRLATKEVSRWTTLERVSQQRFLRPRVLEKAVRMMTADDVVVFDTVADGATTLSG